MTATVIQAEMSHLAQPPRTELGLSNPAESWGNFESQVGEQGNFFFLFL